MSKTFFIIVSLIVLAAIFDIPLLSILLNAFVSAIHLFVDFLVSVGLHAADNISESLKDLP